MIPIAESRGLVRAGGLPGSALIVVGTDHRLADPGPLAAMPEACEGRGASPPTTRGHAPGAARWR